MENTSIKPQVIRWGLILGLVSAVFTVVVYITELYLTAQWVNYLGLIFTIAFMFLACKEYKDEHEGMLQFGKGFLIAFLVGVIGAIVGSLVNYVYISFVDTGIMQSMIDAQMEKMANNPNISDEQMEAAEGTMSTFMNPIFISISGIVGGAFFSAILALIVAAIAKNDTNQ